MEEQITPTPERMEVVDIQFRPGQKVYFFDPAGHTLKPGDNVIIDTARGPEFGTCAGRPHAARIISNVGLGVGIGYTVFFTLYFALLILVAILTAA